MSGGTKLGKRSLRVFLGIAAVFAFTLMCDPSPASALDVTLAWDANTEPDLAGYAIYYGIDSGDPYHGEGALEGDSPIDILLDEDEDPDPKVVQFTLHDLPEGTYFFAVTAFNTKGLESDYSNEASTDDLQSGTVGSQMSASHLETMGRGGGSCFVSAALSDPNANQNVRHLLLVLLLVTANLALIAINSRK